MTDYKLRDDLDMENYLNEIGCIEDIVLFNRYFEEVPELPKYEAKKQVIRTDDYTIEIDDKSMIADYSVKKWDAKSYVFSSLLINCSLGGGVDSIEKFNELCSEKMGFKLFKIEEGVE